MINSKKKLTGFCIALLLSTLSTASVGADTTSLKCYYDVLTGAYEYLAACGANVGAERYEIYKRLHNAMRDFINSNSPPDRPRIDSASEENDRELARLTAKKEKCQGEVRQFADYVFEAWMTEEFATQLLGKLSHPQDPYKGDCL